ncbi:MAG: L,D-transpeptidase [Pseudomonadota bacterium]
MRSRLWTKMLATAVALASLFASISAAHAATVVAKVDLSRQRMNVYVDGRKKYTWVVSTGRQGWRTKPGVYTPYKMKRHYYSKRWRMSLPYLIWIGGDGTAVHGTTYAGRLGRPASHGCIRLSIRNAAKFYRLVERHGMWGTRVEVVR